MALRVVVLLWSWHAEHCVAPCVVEKYPLPHGIHPSAWVVAPAWELYVPAGQRVGADTDRVQYAPAGQMEGEVDPGAQKYPEL